MTNKEDCPVKTNDEVSAEFVDGAAVDRLTTRQTVINERARMIAGWKADKLPKANADNAARLHTSNRKALREAGAIIDEFRAGEGRDAYNAKRREQYAESKGEPVRGYASGMSDDAKAERRRQQKREAEQKRRSAMTQADKDADAARRKRKRNEAKELAEIDEAAELALRSIV